MMAGETRAAMMVGGAREVMKAGRARLELLTQSTARAKTHGRVEGGSSYGRDLAGGPEVETQVEPKSR